MKRKLENRSTACYRLLSIILSAGLASPIPATADLVALATAPLATSTTSSVLPNLMFILDNSGSMGQDFTPDYMSSYDVSVASNSNPWTDNDWSPGSTEKVCKDSADDDGIVSNVITTASNTLDLCVVGDVPYMTSSFNSQYYNPEIRYWPGNNADQSFKPSQSNPASVLTDGFDKQKKTQINVSQDNINLISEYPDRVWCTINNPTPADLIDTAVCRKNSDYLYPDATFKYGRTSSGAGSNVLGVYGAPYYYQVVPTEYCTEANLKVCTSTSTPVGAYTFPARSRWCSDSALTVCQATKTATYLYPRYISAITTDAYAAGYATVGGTSRNKCFSSIKVNDIEILGANICWGNSESDAGLANLLKNQINSYVSTPDYTAAINGSNNKRIDITATTVGPAANGNITYTSDSGVTLSMPSGQDITGGSIASTTPAYSFARTDIVSTTTHYPKVTDRTDCSGVVGTTGCTYPEEITNFGNWYAYYRTRMQSMKSAASRVFSGVDDKYRVGFITISNQSTAGNYLPIAKFDNVATGSEAVNQKSTWFTRFFAISPSSSTPLRSALSTVGRIFAGLKPVGTSDPIQYSCQQNFALLTTDGYWNTDSDSDVKDLDGNAIGNLDGGTTARPMYEGDTATEATLADAAKYFYDTDLRSSALGNCTGAPSVDFPSGTDVCENNVFKTDTDNKITQHLTTFTLGLGVDGTITYSNDYRSALKLESPPTDARLDFYNIAKAGTANWPVPVSGNETTVDDLWHAAINGRGTYFSAANPTTLAAGLAGALADIGKKIGSAAAAATSTLNPVADNNYAYVASYTTNIWKGNLEARGINTNTGEVSLNASWCLENIAADDCDEAPVESTDGDTTIFNCITSPAVTCPGGELVGDVCTKPVATACAGTMNGKVLETTDTRNIYTANATGGATASVGSLISFDTDFADDYPTYFDATRITPLSQWISLTDTQRLAAVGHNLVNFLRGRYGNEDRTANPSADRLYRYREAVLGDALESQPAFISKPVFSYPYKGYNDYVVDNINRLGTVYMGTNDGMMHAIRANTEVVGPPTTTYSGGSERWAYVPSLVIPNMWKLADKNYAIKHANFVNGSPITSDVCVANCRDTDTGDADWRTILVAGLNGGGRGYYALDITNPHTPTLLWQFTPTTGSDSNDISLGYLGSVKDADLGYSFGTPIITKKTDGTWVVLVTSGYNNANDPSTTSITEPGNGKGYLYVLNAATGAIISKIVADDDDLDTPSIGSTTTPSGLAKIAGWNDEPVGNKVGYVYGGDLLGNLWRFDINSATAATIGTGAAKKLAELYSDTSALGADPQPITTTPTLGKVSNNRVVFIGTGKFLEVDDLSPPPPSTNTIFQTQSLYAIKDDDSATLINPRNTLVGQTLTDNPDGTATRIASSNAVSFSSGRGWYVDFPDNGERVNIDSKLVLGALLVPSIVPSVTVCSPGGTGWLNVFDYETGKAINTTASLKYDAPIVGVNVYYIEGEPKVAVVTATNPTPDINEDVEFPPTLAGFSGTRVIWRELLP